MTKGVSLGYDIIKLLDDAYAVAHEYDEDTKEILKLLEMLRQMNENQLQNAVKYTADFKVND